MVSKPAKTILTIASGLMLAILGIYNQAAQTVLNRLVSYAFGVPLSDAGIVLVFFALETFFLTVFIIGVFEFFRWFGNRMEKVRRKRDLSKQ